MVTYDDLIERYTRWAMEEPEVRAAMILGSRARKDHPADEWSDLDIVAFVLDPQKFIQSAEWATSIAPCWLSFIERSGDGSGWERRSLYEGGLDVDVALDPDGALDGILHGIPPDVADIIRRGVRVLVDKDGKLAKIQQMPLPPGTIFMKPSESEFVNAAGDFWYHSLWSAKHLRRGELWWAKSGVDGHMKSLLQGLLECHAHATRGETFDTWLRGRFLEEWADPRAVKQLRVIFAHYDAKDIARALRETMNLFRWLEDETAEKWGYSIPREGEDAAARDALFLIRMYE